MTDSATNSPQNERRETDENAEARRLENQMVPLLRQTNQLLTELLAAVRGSQRPVTATPRSAQAYAPAHPGAAVAPALGWLERWMETVNRAFELETSRDVREAIQAALRQPGEKWLVLDFDDVGEYQRDHNYAQFSLNNAGCLVVIPFPDNENKYAAFPYPSSDTWFLQGKATIKSIYQVLGTDDAYAPRLRLLRPATLRLTDAVNPRGNLVFVPLEKGKMIAQ